MTIHQTKAGGKKRVPMNSTVQRVLSELNKERSTLPEDRIFTHARHALREVFHRSVMRAGLSPFRFHDLRHTFASRLAMQGANDRTLMALGGWKSPAMLARYAHLGPSHLWNAVEGLTKSKSGTLTGTGEGSGTTETVEETQVVEKIGEPPRARTGDTRLKRAVLYQLS